MGQLLASRERKGARRPASRARQTLPCQQRKRGTSAKRSARHPARCPSKLIAEMAALRSSPSLLQESHADLHTLSVIVILNSNDKPMMSEIGFKSGNAPWGEGC